MALDRITVDLLSTSMELDSTWRDVGGEIPVIPDETLGFYTDVDINDSSGVMFRFMNKLSPDATNEYVELQSTSTTGSAVTLVAKEHKLDTDADQKVCIQYAVNNVVPYVQIQAKVQSAGPVSSLLLSATIRHSTR